MQIKCMCCCHATPRERTFFYYVDDVQVAFHACSYHKKTFTPPLGVKRWREIEYDRFSSLAENPRDEFVRFKIENYALLLEGSEVFERKLNYISRLSPV